MAGPLRVLFLPRDAPPGLVAAANPEGTELIRLEEPGTAALHRALADTDVVIGDWSGGHRLGEAEAAVATRLRLVQQPGAGVEMIDRDAFARRGVPVANTGSVNASAVAEWCLGAVLNRCRPYQWADERMREGEWTQMRVLTERNPHEIFGSAVGIVGAGAIAHRLADAFAVLGARVVYWSPRSRIEEAVLVDLPTLFTESDIVIVAIARGPETLGLIGADLLDRMSPTSMLVDVSRGGIVDQETLVTRLNERRIGAAALDVFASEPFALPTSWILTPQLLVSPHAAGATLDAMRRMYAVVTGNILAVANGGALVNVVG